MSWECQVHRSADQQLEGFSDLTVGEVFGLSCRGETVDNLQAEAVKLALPEESPFDYKILEIKKMAADGGEFLMTTYRAPSEGLGPLTLTDGHQQWELQIEPITVASVLPQDSAEPPLPYGPYGPFVLGWPLWLLLFAIPLILLVVWPTVILIKRVQRSRRIREVLAATKGTLTPLENFHKAQRQIVKGLHVFNMGEPEQKKEGLSKIRSTFARYLLQEFRALATSEGLTGVEKRRC